MIIGERIRLRGIDRQDLPHFAAWLNDPEVRENLSMVTPLSQADEEKWFETMMQTPAVEHPMTIEVKDGDEWTAVGNVGLFNFDWRNRSAELGIFIGEKRFWNQGYGSETVRLMLKHGFETLNLHRIYLRVYASNRRGIRAYEKAGFVHEGAFRQAEFRGNRYQDVLFMSVLSTEWIRTSQ
ncbi:MAG: GNAT family N-acetyltransferase [Chloroflexota bacterium]